jgi:hypothetical protein
MGERGLGELVMACRRGDEVATEMLRSGRERGSVMATRTPRQEVVAASTGPVKGRARKPSRLGMRRNAHPRRGSRESARAAPWLPLLNTRNCLWMTVNGI